MTLGRGHASAGARLGAIAAWKLHLACVQIILVDPLVQALVDWQRGRKFDGYSVQGKLMFITYNPHSARRTDACRPAP